MDLPTAPEAAGRLTWTIGRPDFKLGTDPLSLRGLGCGACLEEQNGFLQLSHLPGPELLSFLTWLASPGRCFTSLKGGGGGGAGS